MYGCSYRGYVRTQKYVRPARTVGVTLGLWGPKLNSLHILFPPPSMYTSHVKLHTTLLRIKVPLLLSIKLVLPTYVQFMHEWITIFMIKITNYWNTTPISPTYNTMMTLDSSCRISAEPKVVTCYTAGLDTRHKWKKLSGLRSNCFSFEAIFTSLYCVCLSAHSYIKLYCLQKLTDFHRTSRNII